MPDRRRAPRHHVPPGLTTEVNGVPVELVELSLVGAKLEHQQRFPLTNPQLTIRWQRKSIVLPMRPARSQVVGREGEQLVYETGVFFTNVDADAESFVSRILHAPEAMPVPVTPPPEPPPRPSPPNFDDTFTRNVSLLRLDIDEVMPYARFRLTPDGWRKDYIASPQQPPDGFTVPRDRRDFDELQRTFEAADPETRRMMQIALESQLG
jgi:hypothetical protein